MCFAHFPSLLKRTGPSRTTPVTALELKQAATNELEKRQKRRRRQRQPSQPVTPQHLVVVDQTNNVPRKVVSFEPITEIHPVLGRDDFTKDERNAYWFTTQELQATQADASRTVKLLMSGKMQLQSDIDDHCTLGLEAYTPENKELRHVLIDCSKDDLFCEQTIIRERQLFEFVPNVSELLAKLYVEHSRQTMEAARLRAMRNEFDVQEEDDDDDDDLKTVDTYSTLASTATTSAQRSIMESRMMLVQDQKKDSFDSFVSDWESEMEFEVCEEDNETSLEEADHFDERIRLESNHRHMCRSPYRASLIERAQRCQDV